jgi:4-amino-4-deoxy-L-arabinose transferase-like glycosyltransferase
VQSLCYATGLSVPSGGFVSSAAEPVTAGPGRSADVDGRSRLPWAALLLAAVVLLPFLHKAYTIDDPVFVHEARSLLAHPLHPTAFELVWSSERRLRASEFLPGGPVAAYLLVPLALAGGREWAGHLLMLVYFGIAIAATAALARRLGLSRWTQQAAALLTASSPAALGMAGTVMPDIPAMMFAVLGMERLLAWMETRRRWAGIAAAVFLALAALTRIHLLILLAVAGYYAARRSWVLRRQWGNVAPVLLAGALVLLVSALTRDPDARGGSAVSAVGHQLGLDFTPRHVVALFIAYLTTTPLVAALLTRRRLEPSRLLWAWLLVPLPLIAYVQVAPKYLLPALPAVAILAAYGLDCLTSRNRTLGLLTAAGTVLGLLILMADARMAGTARTAAAELIRPRVRQGERVWFAGHWGFHWYAEQAGALPLSVDPPFPTRGDVVVASTVDRPVGLLAVLPRTLIENWGSTAPAGQVMSAHAGFYSDLWGLLPWAWERPSGPPFQVWRVTR